jgi:mutator protein MutT
MGNASNTIVVTAGLIFRQGRLLITQRRQGDHLGGLWEFPGGKQHANETLPECLVRELEEELAITVRVGEIVDEIEHTYPEKRVHITFFRCLLVQGEPQAIQCQAVAWVQRHELEQYAFPAADAQLLTKLRQGDKYWQT